VVVVVVIAAAGLLALLVLPLPGPGLPELAHALEGLLPRAVHHVEKLAHGAYFRTVSAPRAGGLPYLVSHDPIMPSFPAFLIELSAKAAAGSPVQPPRFRMSPSR
jgi:hypothetical protein